MTIVAVVLSANDVAPKTLHKSLMNLLNLKRTHLQQYPKGSSAWNRPHCAEVLHSSVIIHSVFNGFTNTTSVFHSSIDADDDDDDGDDDDDDDDYYDDGDNDDEVYDDDHNNSNF
jgi:hypothetical protein